MAARHWAQFKGGRFPAVAVRDLAIQPRDNDLVLATHGRGIWIIDDITPLRALTPDLLTQEASFVSARPGPAAHRRQRRLGQRRRRLYRRQSARRRGHHLLPEGAASLRQTEARSARFFRPSRRRAAGQQTAGLESRDLEHAGETAARSAGRADCFQRNSRPASCSRCLHRAPDEKWESDRNQAYGRARSARQIQRSRSQSAVRCGDESAGLVRRRKRADGSHSVSARRSRQKRAVPCRRPIR